MSLRVARWLAALAYVALVSAHPSPASDQAERDRIQHERGAVQQAYTERERECQTRFSVTACIDAARRDQREALARLRSEQNLLEESQRKQRAADRAAAIRRKVSDQEERDREAVAPMRREAVPRAATASAPLRTAAGSTPAPASAADRSGAEARSRARFDARQLEAQAHREAVERRNAQRASTDKPLSAPLPVPGASTP
jgi:colicin import membrane protein